jgi:hypothetical protein
MTEAYQTAPAQFASQPEWHGLTSSKFREPEKKHFVPNDMMKTIEGADDQFLGRKHYTPTYGTVMKEKLGLKVFPDRQNRGTKEDMVPVKTKSQFNPTVKPSGHREKRHLSQDSKGELNYTASIKTFHPLPCNGNENCLEKTMGQKKIVDGFEDQRNAVGVRSLGDKAYKNPEYAPRFYYEGGLVPGSTNSFKTTKKSLVKPKTEQEKNKLTGTKWTDRVRQEELEEEEKAVKSLFDWEQNTLKEANPKWRDPDAVEPEMPKVDPKADPKNAKKPAPKK